MQHFPKGARYSALEKNVLKHRAFEMILTIYYVEGLRSFVVDSIRATDRHRAAAKSAIPRLPNGTKNLYGKAWQILVDDEILTSEEAAEIQALIEYRNVIAHATEDLITDVNRTWSSFPGLLKHEPTALERIMFFVKKIESGMGPKYVLSLSLRSAVFEPAEKTYSEELRRLEQKIRRQARDLMAEIDEVNTNIASLPSSLLAGLEPGHPEHMTRSGTLSRRGVECCYSLFREGATPLAVAYLMRISLRASNARYVRWLNVK